MPHVLLWILLPCLPLLIFIPLRFLDREPSNEITDEQDPREGRPRDGAEMVLSAAGAGPLCGTP